MSQYYLRIDGETTLPQTRTHKLTKRQRWLLLHVQAFPCLTTAELRRSLGSGYYQAYESFLRDRLFRLAQQDVITFEETISNGYVTSRRWFPVESETE